MNNPITTRAAFVRQGGGVELRQVETPALEEGSVLVHMKASGVCGTDLEKLTGQGITSTILGHEVSGIIVESSAPGFEKGDRVIPHHHVACNQCELCLAGAQTMCGKYKKSNFVPRGICGRVSRPGIQRAEWRAVQDEPNLGFDDASFAEPLGCCIRGLTHAGAFNTIPRFHETASGAGGGRGPHRVVAHGTA